MSSNSLPPPPPPDPGDLGSDTLLSVGHLPFSLLCQRGNT